ncbi:MAG: hypothetical protein JWM98_3060 [Thermoleophilia bacterium]|nr:hypothetical protein [Thermoleophilia bacterium]
MHRSVWTVVAVACAAALCAGCGGGRDDSAGGSEAAGGAAAAQPTFAREQYANTDAAGRAQRVPAAERIDVGGDEALRPFVLEAKAASERTTPRFAVTVDTSFYGSGKGWGLCLGSSEVAALGNRQGWGTGLEGCEKTGIFLTSLPVAQGAWLVVGSRAAMRPEVEAYVDRSIDAAPAAARAAGVAPLAPAALARTRAQWKAFVARFRAAGTEPMVG